MKLLQSALLISSAILLTACGNDKTAESNKGSTSGDTAQSAQVVGTEPKRPECIAPAKPGGGFDLTCKLIQSGLSDTKLLNKPMRVTYMPGGNGAVAYNKIVANDRSNGDAIIAFSTGSVLNLVQGKYGQFNEKDVKWLAGVGADYGAVAVREDSPYKNLTDLANALKADPKKVSFGAGGSVGSQDWIQTALVAKAAGVDPKEMSFTSMEGGGEVITAALGGHIQVISGAVAELMPYVASGKVRVLAVFAPQRLEGSAKDLPTAKEQGFDIEWPVVRGYYMGPDVSAESYAWWQQNVDKMLTDPKFAEIRTQRELFPFAMTGDEFTKYIHSEADRLRKISEELGLANAESEKPKS